MANYTLNQELNGIEIKFEAKPAAATLDSLKSAGFRWHRAKKVWYAKQTADRIALAESIADGQPAPAKDEKIEAYHRSTKEAGKMRVCRCLRRRPQGLQPWHP